MTREGFRGWERDREKSGRERRTNAEPVKGQRLDKGEGQKDGKEIGKVWTRERGTNAEPVKEKRPEKGEERGTEAEG